VGNLSISEASPADSFEPSRESAVRGISSGRDRRPESLGASTQERPPHEAFPQPSQVPLLVHPQDVGRDVDRSREARSPAAPRFTLLPAAGDGETQRDHPEERRAVDAGDAARKPRRATRIDSISLTIQEIPAENHDQPAAREAIRLMAQWLCRRYDSRQIAQRKAA